MDDLKVGSIVRLKCGSPYMVIGKMLKKRSVAVCWYSDGMIHGYELPIALLEPVDLKREAAQAAQAETMILSALRNQRPDELAN